ncbi:MAG: transporter related [Bryobacterales bacterium]|nr:transporter related [Bryobacterales bacterium]
MSVLLTCDSLEKSFGSRTVFTGISLSLHDEDRMGIIGPNGAGKSTFLKILGGEMSPDNGNVAVRKGVRLAMVSQDPVFDLNLSVREIITAAAKESDGKEVAVSRILSRVGFNDPSALAGTLSGGWKKRLAVAAALAAEPDIMLLDEPTNHLDVEGILWLEKLLKSAGIASIFVTHDRYFLEEVCTRVAEINRAYPLGLFTAAGSYSRFLEKRAEFLHAQRREQDALANLVEKEIAWLRRGAKARTRKSKARIDDAMESQAKLADVSERNSGGVATIDFTSSGRLTKRLVVCEGVEKSLGGRKLFSNLTFTLGPGARLGVLGANGAGKTTLIRCINGEIPIDAGEIRRAEGLNVVYFEQDRESIPPETPLRRALSPGGDTVQFRGRTQHVAGWAARFLFKNEQLDLPVGNLSGGERARVHIARLMLLPADILLLDEPTNDLDIPTLEVLEANLEDFPGAMVLVTHDRYLLDRLSTTLLSISAEGETEFYAELSQWEQANAAKKSPVKAAKAAPGQSAQANSRKKLSYNESREWEAIEGNVAKAEEVLHDKREQLEKPEVTSDPAGLLKALAELDEAQAVVDKFYERWAELEAKQAG